MQVFGQFIATVGWLGLALVASELGATLIHWLGQWVGFRLIGARIVRITGFRLQLSRIRGHWKLERPLTRHPHIVAAPPADAKRFNHAIYCFGGGLFNLLTVMLSLITLNQFKFSFDLWLFAFIIWIWVNTLKAAQLLPMNLHGYPTAGQEFRQARESTAAMTAAYVTACAAAVKVQTGSVRDLDTSMIVMPRDGGNRNYLVVRQAWLILEWGLQHGLDTPELLAGLSRLEPSFNTLPPADLAKYLDATLYWNLVTNHRDPQIIAWYQDDGVQQLLRRYQPLAHYKLTAVYEWRVHQQPEQALALIEKGLKIAQRLHDEEEIAWLKALRVQVTA
ncbi:hypothetical protein C1940_07370 [Lactiplantibacillus plantarum subsp. plantarum]|uniref:hypothetical protein n=1 Tax=Lactiplantibacillus plantarum TaxID=1590 RepID=UPI000CD356EA|nr:hypothetical protein [Lactiplantibacillus plantarum]AUV72291.1 hypothetical protein C1940_07370 [Lactiplantibacillus plantarum subsp. plantarum]